MFKLLALISVLTATALADSSTSNTLIPSGISDSCKTYLIALNSDPSVASCLSALTNITSLFSPGAATPSSSTTASSLTTLCNGSVSNACPQSVIRQSLTAFDVACSPELTSSVEGVRTIYEVLYTFYPLLTAVCSKDDSGNFCVVGPNAAPRETNEDSSFGMSEIMALFYTKSGNGALTRRDQPAIVPNLTAMASMNLPFLFIAPNLSASQLCVTCTRQVLTAYINFESNIPFAYNINQSVLLGKQSALYNAVQSECPANFLSGAVAAAGGLSGSSAISTYDAEYQRIIALVMGAVTVVALAL